MSEQIVYRGVVGVVSHDDGAYACVAVNVIGDVIHAEADTREELPSAFQCSVDDYFDMNATAKGMVEAPHAPRTL